MEINGNTINKISGPVSFYLLLPGGREINLYKKSKINPPIIMLFGDSHFDRRNLCSDCEIINSCYNIWSKNLLDLLDNLATRAKLDFNLETGYGFGFKEIDIFDDGPLNVLKKNIIPCFEKSVRCPAKNIKWNYVDARTAGKNFKYNYESLFSVIEIGLNNLIQGIKTEKHITLNEAFNSFLSKTLKYYNLFPSIEIFDILIDILTELSYENFFQEPYINLSLLYKQIKKLPEPLNDIEYWKFNLGMYIEHIMFEYFTVDDRINAIKFLRDYKYLLEDIGDIGGSFVDIITEINKDYDDERKETLLSIVYNPTILKMLIYFNSIFLDAYYVLRTLKLPENPITKKFEENPAMSIGYFGNLHVKNITYFLTNILHIYNMENKIEKREDSDNVPIRCIDFTKEKINVDKILVKHFL
jgi:hypothetical protein